MMTRTVPKFKLEFDEQFVADFSAGCAAILRGDTLQEGLWVRRFERELGKFISAPHCVATSSGTTALEVALRAIGVRGKDVIVPTNTFIATAIAVERAGGILKLADIEMNTFAMSQDVLDSQITEKTGAVVLVHIGGVISKDVEDIVEICSQKGVPLVEDAAHAHGATRGKLRAGTIGDVAAFSFFPTKVMTCAEGGMVTTKSADLAERVRTYKDFGRISAGSPLSFADGINAKMTEFQGLLGSMELERLPKRRHQRALLAAQYISDLASSRMKASTETGSFYKLVVRTDLDVEKLKEFCRARGVELAGEVYRYPLHQQPVFERRFGDDFPVANEFCQRHICPPLYPEMDVDDVNYVCEVLRAAEKEL